MTELSSPPCLPGTPDDLHPRLLVGDPLAFLELVETQLSVLVARLRRQWPTTPRELCEEAALEALYNLLRNPSAYDPRKSRLATYLFRSAHRDVQNILDREERQRSPRAHSLDRVEVGPDGRKGTVGTWLIDLRADAGDGSAEIDPALAATIAAALPDERDRRAFDLMVDEERDTAVFAVVLGLVGLSPEEQRLVVKRAKDRIQKRVRRALERRGHD